MLKHYFSIGFILISLFFGKCYAQSQFSATLTKMEKSLFGMDYETQTDTQRLNRLEENVYGKPSSSQVPQRIAKLTQDLSADLIGQEIKPKTDTFADEEEAYKDSAPKADSSVNYPIVNSLEQKMFSKEFKTTEINQRLSNLEQKVFKKTYNDDLSARVDRLKLAVMPQQQMSESEDEDNYIPNDILSQNSPPKRNFIDPPENYYEDDNAQTPAYNSRNSVSDGYQSDSDIVIPLAAMEKKILKKSYPDDITSNRLARLEIQVLGTNFSDDDEQTRLDRIASAYQAKKSARKYDNNSFSQHMSTAMQIGTFLLLIVAAIL